MLCSLLLLALTSPAHAGDWPTTGVTLIDTRTAPDAWHAYREHDRVENGNAIYDPDGFDVSDTLQGDAPVAWEAITSEVRWALVQLDTYGYPPPAHTLIEDDFGQQFWPAYVWDEATGTLKYSQQCSGHLGRTYWNPGIWNPAAVGTPFGPDGSRHRQRTMVSWISATWVHEMVHASQSRANQPGCNVGPAWLGEGIADAVSWYLAAKRFPELDWLYELALSRRRWDRSLDLRQIRGQADHESESYTTASLYRYLAEATETTGTSGLEILKPLVTARFSEPDHREAVRLIDRTVEEHTGRRFYQVFPEFLTEYASYGGSRYTRTRVQGTQSVYSIGPHDWQADVLGRCTSLVLSPVGDQLTAEARIDVNVLAGACVNITWAGFEQPVGLQIEARATDPDSLHLGEAWRQHQSGAEYFCWEVVKNLDERARKKAADKCMLSRELRRVGSDEAAHWTSDFDVGIGGGATFVLANIAEQPLKTVPQVVQLRVSTLKAEADGAAMTPPADKPVDRVKGAPVKQGLSSMRERLHTMTFGEDRRFFDGRSTLAGNRDFAFGDGTDGEGVGAMIRAREYMVVFARPQSGSASAELGSEASAIIKDPASMGGFSGMGLPAIVMSAGSEGLSVNPECGYTDGVETTVLGESGGQLHVRIEADLFDVSKAQGEGCAALEAAWVEKASITLWLPQAQLLDPDQPVERLTPPGQALYDSEFVAGPMFGGIATAESLRTQGWPDLDALRAREPSGPVLPDFDPSDLPGVPDIPDPPEIPDEVAGQIPETPDEVCQMLIDNGMLKDADATVVQITLPALRETNCLCAVAEAAASGTPGFSPAARQGLARAAASECP